MEKKEIAVVTGGNGFVGSHLVDLLLEKGYTVRCLVRKSSNLKWLKDKPVEIFNTGLFDKEGLRKAFTDARYIYHVAGVVKAKDPADYFKGNVETTRTILEVAFEFPETIKRILIVSSQTAAGPSPTEIPLDETIPCNPITTYARSKVEEEKVAQSFMDRLPVTICRAPAVYGERDTEIFIFFKTFASGLMTTIGFNRKLISLIHVVDLVNGFLLAALSPVAQNQTYFISSEKLYTWEEIGEVTSKVMNKKPLQVKVPHFIVFTIAAIAQFFAMFSSKAATLNIEKAKDLTQQYWTCSTQKAMKDLGYSQKIPVAAGIERTVRWYKEQGWIK
ncbi:MAG TPA: NAD-dependent epimerase/dehydratase family protein [Ignavibacteriaceae bacterium]|nr:NAD-dependent epimerase/dehydratase family protein [Ignavibacteriaceae bacterium]